MRRRQSSPILYRTRARCLPIITRRARFQLFFPRTTSNTATRRSLLCGPPRLADGLSALTGTAGRFSSAPASHAWHCQPSLSTLSSCRLPPCCRRHRHTADRRSQNLLRDNGVHHHLPQQQATLWFILSGTLICSSAQPQRETCVSRPIIGRRHHHCHHSA